jgi:hypothetical protein
MNEKCDDANNTFHIGTYICIHYEYQIKFDCYCKIKKNYYLCKQKGFQSGFH